MQDEPTSAETFWWDEREDAPTPHRAPLLLSAADAAPASPAWDEDPDTIDYTRLLNERPDVLKSFYEAYHRGADPNSTAWQERVGGTTPEAYARYWYAEHGRYEGYAQGPTTAQDTVSLERILQERPDVLRAYYEGHYGPGNDPNSSAWMKRVGGDTPEAYAKYWYEKYGRWEGYAQTEKAAAEAIDVARLLDERPDVFRAYFEQFYGAGNDRKSGAWVDRVGGDTVEDYAKYWYVAHGRAEGYTQNAPSGSPPTDGGLPPDAHDPADDPWNHPAIFPDWTPPYEGWEPPPDIWHGGAEDDAITPAPVSLFEPDPLG
jgi:hypothetical protein